MCELCIARASIAGNRKRRIWEINGGWYCSIVGTCLTLGDLRVLARKLGFRSSKVNDTDYYLHGHFVREAGSGGRAGKMLNKLLDRKHAAAIKRFQRLTTVEELADAWQEAYDAGDIPGPYWALLSHAALDETLGLRVYGQVHMLSHLVGASNRADIAALNRMEAELAEVQEQAERDARRHQQRTSKKERAIADLRREVGSLKGQLAEAAAAANPDAADVTAAEATIGRQEAEITDLRVQLEALNAEVLALRDINRQQAATVSYLEAEQRALEQVLDRNDERSNVTEICRFNLDGRCILYVGGRTPHVCRLRDLVARWNGELLHHDGGLERSIDELASAVTRADAVVFPTDCVSHKAVQQVKRLCRQSMKPYVPLRTSGVASFVAGLKDGLDGIAMSPDPN